MVVVHGTRRFLDKVPPSTGGADARSTTALGAWYATVLRWRPQVALFVNEPTLLPVLVKLAPGASLIGRFRTTLATILERHGLDAGFIAAEVAAMGDHHLTTTNNRSVVGVMTEFGYLADAHTARPERVQVDLDDLSIRLARTPCGPLRTSYDFPDRALVALACEAWQRSDN